ncbi:MAG: hypothetical protein HQL98_09660 [Magnetococcales bacterium]|nr:hypothetical protein [Magnetococcales bacterium]
MSFQQVNFYQDLYRPRFDPLAARTLVRFTIGLAGVLVLSAGMLQWYLSGERSGIKRLQLNKDTLTARVAELGAQYPVQSASESLTRTIGELENEKKRKSRMVALLGEGKIGNTTGFASLFRELAHSRTEGVWLTGIGVFEGGGQLLIEGAAHQNRSEQIPLWLQAFTRRAIFAGRTFGHLRIEPVKEHPEWLHFDLKTDPDKSLDRFWEEKKDEGKGPPVLQKAKKGMEEARDDMKKVNPLKSPPGAQSDGNKGAKP